MKYQFCFGKVKKKTRFIKSTYITTSLLKIPDGVSKSLPVILDEVNLSWTVHISIGGATSHRKFTSKFTERDFLQNTTAVTAFIFSNIIIGN